MRRAGFTLLEMIVVIAIIGVLATLVITKYAGQTDQAKVAAAKAKVAQIESAIISYSAHTGKLPQALIELVERPGSVQNWQEGGYLKGKGTPKDPWGYEFQYRVSGRKFELLCLGADGLEGGTGVDQDISSDDLEGPK